jgi:hypothetical protein
MMMIIACLTIIVRSIIIGYLLDIQCSAVFTHSIGQSELFSRILYMTPGASSSTVQGFFTSAERTWEVAQKRDPKTMQSWTNTVDQSDICPTSSNKTCPLSAQCSDLTAMLLPQSCWMCHGDMLCWLRWSLKTLRNRYINGYIYIYISS